jgi:hypothetical protein
VKLRIQGNSLRLRVTRSEVARLLAGGEVVEVIRFAVAPEAALAYVLGVDRRCKAIQVSYGPERLSVMVTDEQLKAWSDPSQVGIYAVVPLNGGEQLEISIEKDFACLDRRDGGDEDAFPNPNAVC